MLVSTGVCFSLVGGEQLEDRAWTILLTPTMLHGRLMADMDWVLLLRLLLF